MRKAGQIASQVVRIPRWKIPFSHRSWVLDEGSLTKRLKQASEGDFRVELRFLGWRRPTIDEACHLGMASGELALIREVDLMCHGEIWVKAHSVIPASTLTGAERQLKSLGTKPLGEFLFTSRCMRRSKLEPFYTQTKLHRIFGRRSVFYLHDKPLLVSEQFMPPLFISE